VVERDGLRSDAPRIASITRPIACMRSKRTACQASERVRLIAARNSAYLEEVDGAVLTVRSAGDKPY
jgi:hypothetical protein